VDVVEIETPSGLARAHLRLAQAPRGALVLGHGAGGGVEARDLAAATEAALEDRVTVALVEQPYRVAGKRAPASAPRLDAAWTAVIETLRAQELRRLPLVTGGRSLGARVACRTAEDTDAVAVLCLAFPLQPPPRKGKEPGPSRIDELHAVEVPTLVVLGESDRFGMPPPGPRRTVVRVPGDHGLKADLDAVRAAVRGWLPVAIEAAG
jgi:predicted alpha/beta-hydrolase family hydrolase